MSVRRRQAMKKLLLTVAVVLVTAGVAAGQDLGDIKKKIADAANQSNWSEYCSAVKELGSVDSLESAKLILKFAFALDTYNVPEGAKADAFEAGRSALAQLEDAEALDYLREQLLRNKSQEVRCMLADVLGGKGGEENRRALCELLEKEKASEVIRKAIEGIVRIGGTDSVDTLIEVLEKLEGAQGLPWIEVRTALTALTGYDYGTAAKWKEFWKARKEELEANPGSPDTAAPKAPDDVKTGLLEEEKRKAPKFFGKEILSKRFCFIIDVSGSMAEMDTYSGGGGEAGGKGTPVEAMRIEMVKDQLIKLITALDPKTKFNILAYSYGVNPWQKQQLVFATSKAKTAAIEFVKKFRPNGTTHTDDALKEAFANKEADTIVLLTDGAPTHSGSYDDTTTLISSIFDFVRNANRTRKAVIDTFGFDSVTSKHQAAGAANPQQFLDFLQRLASENGGKYTSIK
jgi:hypothetical protein